MSPEARRLPLAGVRVVEFTHMVMGPTCGLMLADLGAEVIKVEPPLGDPFRSFRGGQYSPHFSAYNRGKRSINIDLRKDAASLADNVHADPIPRDHGDGMVPRHQEPPGGVRSPLLSVAQRLRRRSCSPIF